MTANSSLKKVIATIREHQLFCEGDTVLVAVSGGADSVALLEMLVSLKELKLHLIVAHLNHHLRGEESDGDAAFVENLAQRHGLSVEIGNADVRALSRDRKLSLEEAGRTARYQWFRELAGGYQACRVALGHHADDQAETFLHRLFRGAGTTGLCAMRPLSAGLFARPLLRLTRSEIRSYLEERGLSFRTDGSNDDRRFLRNRIRHECLPYLASFNPALPERLNAAAEILAADEDVLESLTDQVFGQIATCSADTVTLHLPALRTKLPGMRMRLYRRAIREAKGDLAHVGFSHLKQVDSLVFSLRAHGAVQFPCGLCAGRCYDSLTISPLPIDSTVSDWEIIINQTGVYQLPDGSTLSVNPAALPDSRDAVPAHRAYFDAVANPFPWTVRTFRPGDRFQPSGMNGTKKVKDFFIDRKIPASQRRRIPLLYSGDRLLWICGLRTAEPGRVSPENGTAVLVEIKANTP